MEAGGSRGAGKGQKGKSGTDVIAWLCAFCNTPTGPATEHQRKYCEHLFRPPPIHEVSRARCAFCGHGHLFSNVRFWPNEEEESSGFHSDTWKCVSFRVILRS